MSLDRSKELLLPTPSEELATLEGNQPDIILPGFTDVTPQMLGGLGVQHVVIDVDGVLVTRSHLPDGPNDAIRARLGEIGADDRFTISIATENGNPPEIILGCLGLPEDTELFEPFTRLGEMIYKTSDHFWKLVCAVLGISNSPDLAVMIGDTPNRDIVPAQRNGLRTILLSRLTYVDTRLDDIVASLGAFRDEP